MSQLQIEGFEDKQLAAYLIRIWDFFPNAAHSFFTGAFADTTALGINTGTTRLRTRSFGLLNDLSAGIRVNFSGVPVSGTDSIRMFRGVSEQLRFDIIRGSTTSFFKVQVKRGATTLGTTADISQNAWHYVECVATLHTSTGAYEVFVDEQSLLSATGVNTADSASNQADVIDITLDGGCAGTIDDIMIRDGDNVGDSKILALTVLAEGTTNNWTPSSGSDNAALVDDSPTAVSDSDYIESDTNGNIDLFTHNSLAGITTPILGIQLNIIAAMASAGTRTIRAAVRSSGTNYFGSGQAIASTVFSTIFQAFENNPNTSTAWTQATLNAAELGVDVVS